MHHVHRNSMQLEVPVVPEQEPIAYELIDGHHRFDAAQKLQLEVPVVLVKRYRPKNFQEALSFLSPHQRLLAAQDPARLRFKLQKTPSTYTNDESSVEPEIQDAGGIHYFHHCSFLRCKRKFRCVPHIPKLYTNAPPPLEYGCRCLKENGYDMAKCYCSSDCYYQVSRPYDLY